VPPSATPLTASYTDGDEVAATSGYEHLEGSVAVMRIDMVGLFPKDMEAMVAFYRDVMGMAVEWDGGSYAEFENEGVRFAMYSREDLPELLGESPTYPSALNGTFELAFIRPRSADVDAEFERLVAAGAEPVYAPRDEPWGMRSSMVADPDGNLLEIFSRGGGNEAGSSVGGGAPGESGGGSS
jgi:lactoylglutathione lyase